MAGKQRERTLRDEIRDSGETPSERPIDDSLDEHGYLAREFLTWLLWRVLVQIHARLQAALRDTIDKPGRPDDGHDA